MPREWGGRPPVYIRSEHNFPADNHTRWSDGEAEQWSQQEGMSGANAAGTLWKPMDPPCNPPVDRQPAEYIRDAHLGTAIF